MMQELAGKGVIVTGGSVGLGKAVARACLRAGAHVMICARHEADIQAARRDLSNETDESRVFAMQANVADPASVSEMIDAASRRLPNLLGIVNNAGMQGPKGLLEENDPAEWLHTIEVNLLGTMLCCRAILPLLRQSNYGKIVNLSGGGATGPRARMSAYAASKTAVVRLTETIAEEYAGCNIDVNAIAPGALNTRMLDEILTSGPEKVGETIYSQALRQKQDGGASLDRAADLCVFLLSKCSDKITGKLISAVWDPWESLSARRDQLQRNDVYTLRRVMPKDRGLEWPDQK